MQKLLIIVAIAGFGYFQLRKVLKRGGDVNSALELEVGARHSRIIGVTRQLSSFADWFPRRASVVESHLYPNWKML